MLEERAEQIRRPPNSPRGIRTPWRLEQDLSRKVFLSQISTETQFLPYACTSRTLRTPLPTGKERRQQVTSGGAAVKEPIMCKETTRKRRTASQRASVGEGPNPQVPP